MNSFAVNVLGESLALSKKSLVFQEIKVDDFKELIEESLKGKIKVLQVKLSPFDSKGICTVGVSYHPTYAYTHAVPLKAEVTVEHKLVFRNNSYTSEFTVTKFKELK